MSTSRRGFLGGLAGVFAATPAAMTAPAMLVRPPIGRTVTYVRMDVASIRDKNVLLRQYYAGVPMANFRGIPIEVVG